MGKSAGQRLRQPLALLSAIVAGLLLSACGADSSKPEAAANTRTSATTTKYEETVEECLIEVGVQFAVVPHDIHFLAQARRNQNVLDRGFEHESQDNVVVRVLTARDGGPEKWTIWYSQPPSESLSPRQILEESPPNSYVAFKTWPKPSFRHEVSRCVEFSDGSKL
jgi:hypothetical protein